ncbi:MAG: serine hydrolase domain-containing protein [Bryobacteraceae bacterium]
MRNFFVAVLLTTVVYAQPSPKQAEVDRIFSAFNTHTPGCAVGVAQHGAVVMRAGYGMADLERNVPITAGSVFESGSVAKQFTAAALILLEQQGRISLDDPMRKYLPELADYGAPLTIRHVLSHRSGLREWRPIATFAGRREGTYVYTNEDLLRMAAHQRALNFDPGTHYSYTNTGFNISTILVERALGDGKTFQQYTQDVLFGPLGMTHTRWRDNIRKVVPNRALAYGRVGDELEQQTPIENIIGAGGLLTTVGDLLLWNENFTSAKVGGPEFVKFQQTPAKLNNGRAISYAAGLVVSEADGLRLVAHSGSTGGYRTWLGRYPDQGVSVAVLCNSAQANPTRLGQDTARLWTGATAKPVTSSFNADPVKLKSMAGHYRKLRDNTVSELKFNDGKLTFGLATLAAVEPGKFVAAANPHVEYRFQDGDPSRLEVTTPDDEVAYVRVQPVHPTPADLRPLLGKYESEETGSVLTVASGSTPGELSLRIASGEPIRLRPTFRDGFSMPTGSSIFFVRDSTGKVIALSAGEDRVWDLRFKRVN